MPGGNNMSFLDKAKPVATTTPSFQTKARPVVSPTTPQQQKEPFLDRAINVGAKVTDTIFGGGKIGEALAGGEVSPRELAGSALQSASLFFPAGRVAGIGTKAARYLGMGKALSKLTGLTASGALGGYGFDVATNLQEKKTGTDIFAPGLGTGLGASIPVAGTAIGATLGGVKKAAQWAFPKLLSYTTDIPEQAFDTLIERREPVMKELAKGVSAEDALSQTRGAVRQLRKTLSAEWDESVNVIADEFSAKRMGVSGDLEKKILTLADDFGVDIPQNIKSASVVEWMNTLKSIGELPKLMLSVSPKGVVAREAKKELKSLLIKEFGGEGGSVAKLYQTYAAKKTVFDAANQLVQAYSTGKPIQQSTAVGRLKALFNDNKAAYLDAILQLEKETGTDLLSKITALQFKQKLPNTGTVLSASGGLKSSKGPLDKALDLLLIPLTSPRSAAWIISSLNKASKVIPEGINLKLPGDVILDKFDDATKNIPNKTGGFIKIGDTTVKAIDEPSKKEILEIVDYMKTGNANGKQIKGVKDMETAISRYAEKYGINQNMSNTEVRKSFEKLLENTKTIDRLPGVSVGTKDTDTLNPRNYKTAEEFVKAQGEPVYHGTDAKFSEFSLKDFGKTDEGFLGRGVYMTADKANAKQYGKNIVESFVDLKNPYIYNDAYLFGGFNPAKIARDLGLSENATSKQITDKLKSMGHDGVIVNEITDAGVIPKAEIVVFNPSQIKTRSQLTDIWKKAHEKSP